MGLKNLRNLPVKLDPNDHGYGVPRDEPGEIVVEREPEYADEIEPRERRRVKR